MLRTFVYAVAPEGPGCVTAVTWSKRFTFDVRNWSVSTHILLPPLNIYQFNPEFCFTLHHNYKKSPKTIRRDPDGTITWISFLKVPTLCSIIFSLSLFCCYLWNHLHQNLTERTENPVSTFKKSHQNWYYVHCTCVLFSPLALSPSFACALDLNGKPLGQLVSRAFMWCGTARNSSSAVLFFH